MSNDSGAKTLIGILGFLCLFGFPFMLGNFFRCQDIESQAKRYRAMTRAYEERYGRLPEEYLFNRKGGFKSRWTYEDQYF